MDEDKEKNCRAFIVGVQIKGANGPPKINCFLLSVTSVIPQVNDIVENP